MPRSSSTLIACLLCSSTACLAAGANEPKASTAGPTVRVFTPPLRMPGMREPRRLRVYLPPGYAQGERRYPVLYMFDAQNLFDDATSYAGEWGVDETLDALSRETGFGAILVGLDHGNERRVHELTPYWNLRFVPNNGAAFVDDLVQAIKPFVDANYRTLPTREHTAVMGSSLGGLTADYAIHRHPQVFGRAGVFSPSYWVSDEPFDIARAMPLPSGSRVYLSMGTEEGGDSLAKVQDMATILRTHPGGEDAVRLNVVQGAGHSEAAWRQEFPRAVRWLFGLPPMR
jgi:predicted alpha/beta superfamily hydrolase